LKQALPGHYTLTSDTLDSDCFSALTNSISAATNANIDQEQFCRWMRENFPTLFSGFEVWLRKYSVLSHSSSSGQEPLISVGNIRRMKSQIFLSFFLSFFLA
jgi:hypothetical protein